MANSVEYGSLIENQTDMKNKNLSFTMNGQVGTDNNVKDVTKKGTVTVNIGKLSGSSSVSNNEDNALSVSADVFDSTNVHTLKWTWKPNVSTKGYINHDYKVGLSDTLGTSSNKLPNKNASTSILNFVNPKYSKSTNLRDVRSANPTISVSIPKGDIDDGGSFSFTTGFGSSTTPKNNVYGVGQAHRNYHDPYGEMTLSSNASWVGFGSKLSGSKGNLGTSVMFKWNYDDASLNDVAHMYIYTGDNVPSAKFGTVSGTQTVSVNTTSLPKEGGHISLKSTNNGSAFVITDTDDTNANVKDRSATISYTFDVYNDNNNFKYTKESTSSGSFTIHQAGGNITAPNPKITYNWDISESNLTYNWSDSSKNEYSFDVKSNIGSIGHIGGQLIHNISNQNWAGTSGSSATLSGLSVSKGINTMPRQISVISKVQALFCSENTIKNPVLTKKISQSSSEWIVNPYCDFTLSVKDIAGEDYSIPNKTNDGKFELSLDNQNWGSSINISGMNENAKTFYYRFSNLNPGVNSGGVHGNLGTNITSKEFDGNGGSFTLTVGPIGEVTFGKTNYPEVKDRSWNLEVSNIKVSDLIQNDGVKGFTTKITQTGKPATLDTYDFAKITLSSNKSWCRINNPDVYFVKGTTRSSWNVDVDSNFNSIDEIEIKSTSNTISCGIPTNISTPGSINIFSSDKSTATLTFVSDRDLTFIPSTVSVTRDKQDLSITINLSADPGIILSKNSLKLQTGVIGGNSTSVSLTDTGGSWINTDQHITSTSTSSIGSAGGSIVINRNSGLLSWSKGNNVDAYVTCTVGDTNSVGKNYLKLNNNISTSKSCKIKFTRTGANEPSPTYLEWLVKYGDSSWESISTSTNTSINYTIRSNSPDSGLIDNSYYPIVNKYESGSVTNNPFMYKSSGKSVSTSSRNVYFFLKNNANTTPSAQATVVQGGGIIIKNDIYCRISGGTNCSATFSNGSQTCNLISTDSWNYGGTVNVNCGWDTISDWSSVRNPFTISAITSSGYIGEDGGTKSWFDDTIYKYGVSLNGFNSDKSVNVTVNCGDINVIANNGIQETTVSNNVVKNISLKSDNIHKITSSITWDDNQYTGVWERSFKPSSYSQSSINQTVSRTATVKVKFGSIEVFSDSITFTWTIAATTISESVSISVAATSKTITAFDGQTWTVTATPSHTVTATSNGVQQDWTSKYNAPSVSWTSGSSSGTGSSHTLTAVQGSDGNNTGSISVTFKATGSYDSSKTATTTAILYCYGKSYYNS